jgi:hypothetical protein
VSPVDRPSRARELTRRRIFLAPSQAYNDLESRGRQGSCTVCLALVTGDGQLHVLNLGDSGLHVVRDGMSVFSTNEQQHYFNCPFQLGMGSDDTPADADYYILTDISVGDVIGGCPSDEPLPTLISPPARPHDTLLEYPLITTRSWNIL